jgi:hypothetical protein
MKLYISLENYNGLNAEPAYCPPKFTSYSYLCCTKSTVIRFLKKGSNSLHYRLSMIKYAAYFLLINQIHYHQNSEELFSCHVKVM